MRLRVKYEVLLYGPKRKFVGMEKKSRMRAVLVKWQGRENAHSPRKMRANAKANDAMIAFLLRQINAKSQQSDHKILRSVCMFWPPAKYTAVRPFPCSQQSTYFLHLSVC